MNIFKKAKEALMSLLVRKKVNINKVNDTPPKGFDTNASTHRHRPRMYKALRQHELRDPKKIYELQRNRWKTGGTSSWAKAAKDTDEHKGRQGESVRRLNRTQRHLNDLERQRKNKGAIMGGY